MVPQLHLLLLGSPPRWALPCYVVVASTRKTPAPIGCYCPWYATPRRHHGHPCLRLLRFVEHPAFRYSCFSQQLFHGTYMCALCSTDLLVTVPQRHAESAIENAHRFAPLHADPSPVLFIERGPHDLHEIVGQLLPSVRSFRILSGEAFGYHSSAIRPT